MDTYKDILQYHHDTSVQACQMYRKTETLADYLKFETANHLCATVIYSVENYQFYIMFMSDSVSWITLFKDGQKIMFNNIQKGVDALCDYLIEFFKNEDIHFDPDSKCKVYKVD